MRRFPIKAIANRPQSRRLGRIGRLALLNTSDGSEQGQGLILRCRATRDTCVARFTALRGIVQVFALQSALADFGIPASLSPPAVKQLVSIVFITEWSAV
jgi:hypothetical protein